MTTTPLPSNPRVRRIVLTEPDSGPEVVPAPAPGPLPAAPAVVEESALLGAARAPDPPPAVVEARPEPAPQARLAVQAWLPADSGRPLPASSGNGKTAAAGAIPPGATFAPPVVAQVAAVPAPVAARRGWRGAVWAARGVWLGLAAIGVASVGQWLLFLEPLRGLAMAVLTLAALLGVLAWNGTREAPLLAAVAGKAWRRVAWRRALLLRLAGIAAALGLAATAIRAYLAAPYEVFGLQGWLWLAAMGLLLASCARWYPRLAPEPGPRWTRLEAAGFLGLIALALVTRVAWLDEIPWRFHFDEGYAFTENMHFFSDPTLSLFTTTWHETGLPSLWFAWAGGLMRFTGINIAGVRLGEALIGALTVIPVYGLARLAWGRAAAVVAAFAIAVSAAYIHYSRVSITNVAPAFWWAVCFYFLLRGFRSRRPGDFVWAGLAVGTSMYTYYGTRLLPYLLVAFAAYLVVFHWRAAREHFAHFALVAAGFFVGFGPLLGYFMLHPEMWAGRALSKMNVPMVIPTTWDGWVQDWNVLAPLAWQNFLGLSVLPGRDQVYYAPFLLAPEALLVVLGLGILIWRWRQPAAFLLLLAGLGTVFVEGTLAEASVVPGFNHWSPAFPIFYLALALPLALLLGALRRVHWRLGLAGGLLLAGALVWDAGANIYGYLVTYPPQVPADHSLEAVQGRFLEQVGPQATVHIVGQTWQPLNVEVAKMMAPQLPAYNLQNPSRELPLVGEPGRDQVFAFYNDQEANLWVVRYFYPGGQGGALTSPADPHVGSTYRVPADVALRGYGVRADVTGLAGPIHAQWHGQVPTVGALPADAALVYPLLATWTGAFYLPARGPARLEVQAGEASSVWVQGQSVGPATPLQVDPGWVRFQVQTRLTAPAPVRFVLQQGTDAPAPIDTLHLWPFPPEQGLAVTLAGQTVAHRIDPFVSARGLNAGDPHDPGNLGLQSPANAGGLVRWEGEVQIPAAGDYTMILRTDAVAQLLVDGRPVVGHCAVGFQSPPSTGGVTLSAGWHRVRLDLLGNAEGGVEWLWTRPDGGTEVVPPAALRIGPGASPEAPIAWPAVPTSPPCR